LLTLLASPAAVAAADAGRDTTPPAAQPLYRDPVFDGAADPVVIWNPHRAAWWMFYTNRRARAEGLSGVAWVHGTRIGIAESTDGGATWTYSGEAQIDLPPEIGGAEPTLWAPDVITTPDGMHHMFLTVVPGVFENWNHPRSIVHLTSTDLRSWHHPRVIALASDRAIDASVFALPDGTWRMWYNNERDHKSIYVADSPDLVTWTDKGKVVADQPGEGPKVFRWKGAYWMITDVWRGLAVYRSDDLTTWTRQPGDNLLEKPGRGPDDQVKGGHCDVVVNGDRAFLFYFTHPGRLVDRAPIDGYEQRRSSILVTELHHVDGRLSCDRDAPTRLALTPPPVAPAPVRIAIDAKAPGLAVAPTLHGLFFEDINYAADGGLYAELVENRSFEQAEHRASWSDVVRGGAAGTVAIISESPIHPNNPTAVRVAVTQPGAGRDRGVGLANDGFDGLAVKAGETYRFSLYTRVMVGKSVPLRISLESAGGAVLGELEFDATATGSTTKWQRIDAPIQATATDADARLVVVAQGVGTVDLDMISLFPERTFRGRRNGLRADLAQALADLRPGFLRFPGGCIVEGRDIANAYRWKDTIGDVAERKENYNLWQDRRSPHYQQTYGLGFFEYFQFCEDIGAEPVPVVNCGMACQARQGPCVPMEELGPWVQDALDLIEFANGPATSPWGAKRAAMGHPEPFGLKYLGVGNEQWEAQYFERYMVFHAAIKAKYPEIQIISSSGPFVNDPLWKFAWEKFRTGTPAEVVDEHYYVSPHWLYENVDRYAAYDRSGPKIFVGEFAAHHSSRANDLAAALAEAAYMTGLRKHADVVVMASYAPLLAKFGRDQWRPDLIWFDNTRVVLTPSYHAQALFSRHRVDRVLPVRIDGQSRIQPQLAGRIGVGTWLTQAEFKNIVVTGADGRELYRSDFAAGGAAGWDTSRGAWSVVDGALRQTLEDPNLEATFGDDAWRDTTLTLKARKLAGQEGFLIFFGAGDGAQGRWNLGGWGNHEHGLDVPGTILQRIPGTIETGRWYDVRIESRGDRVKCYLDGKLLQETTRGSFDRIYATAGRDERTGEWVVTVVNPFGQPLRATVSFDGAVLPAGEVRATLLTGARAGDENTLEQPHRVAPRSETDRFGGGAEHTRTYPPFSATVLRLPGR
jgi:alpha-L-arabinofuranosidase